MSSSGGTVTVNITARQTELAAQLAIAKAQLASFSAEVKSLSSQMVAAGTTGNAALLSALTAATTDATAAGRSVAGLGGELKKLDPIVASTHGSISTATREFRALFDELSSGRTRMTPGTLAIIAQRVFGLSGATLAGVGAVVAFAAGIGYMTVKAIEAENALQRLKIAVDFQGLDTSKAELKDFSDAIGKSGEEIVSGMAKIADGTADLKALSFATAQYAEASGEKAPAAIKAMTEAMTSEHLTLTQLHGLFPGVTEDQRENFLSIQQLGDAHKTAAALIGLVDTQINRSRGDLIEYNAGWTSFGNDTRLILAHIQDLSLGLIPLSSTVENSIKFWEAWGTKIDTAAAAMKNFFGITAQLTNAGQVHNDLIAEATRKLDGQTVSINKAAEAVAATKQANQATITAAMQAGEAFDTEGRRATELAAKVELMKRALATPGVSAGQAKALTTELTDAQNQLTEAAKRGKTEEYDNFVAKEDAEADAAKKGSAARIAATTAEVAKAKELFGAESTEYYRAVAKMNEAKQGSGSGNGYSNSGQEEIAQAKQTIAEINANEAIGGKERVAEVKAVYDAILASAKLNKAQRVAIATEETKDLAAAAKQEAATAASIGKDNAQTDVELARIGFQQKRDLLEQEVQEGKSTQQQMLQDLKTTAQAELDLNVSALDDEEKAYDKDSEAFARVENQKRVLRAQTVAEMAKLDEQLTAANNKTADEDAKSWKSTLNQIEGAENTFINDALSGRKTFIQSVEGLTSSFIKKEITDTARGLTERLLLSKEELAQDKSLGQLGVLTHYLFEGQKTSATAAGEAAQLAAKKTAQAAGSAEDAASGSAQIMNDAHKAFSGAYQAVVGIPVVGPILAPIAGATAFAAVAAQDVLTSLDVGAWNVPRDMPAMIHQGESVVPKQFAAGLRETGGIGGGQKNSTTTNTVNLHYQPSVQNDPNKTLEQHLSSDGHSMRSWLRNEIRNGSLRF